MSMADVFYFSTPWKPAPVAKDRHSPRKHFRSTRKRRTAPSNMINPRACVARYSEPVFCPSDVSLFAQPTLFQRPAITTASILSATEDDECNDSDDDEDEDGGVALPDMDAGDEETSYDFEELHTTSDSPVHIENNTYTPEATFPREPDSSRSRPSTYPHSNALRSGHPRPETRDLWAEEDSRRMRLALDGEGPQDVPQFDWHAAQSHRASRIDLHGSMQSDHRRPSVSHSQHSASTFRRMTESNRPSTQATSETPGDFADFIHLGADDMLLDLEALPVDDPRRDYDFAEFMDKWRLRSMHDRRLPLFDPGVQSSVKIGRPQTQVMRRQVNAGGVDMQGINWRLIGPTRKDAALARALLHPSNTTMAPAPENRPKSRASPSDEERQYRFRSFLPTHKAKASHYQLRNVLAASSRNELFYSSGSAVNRASLACPSSSKTVMDFSKPRSCGPDFHVTCLSAQSRSAFAGYNSNSVLIAGGFGGEYSLLNLDRTSQKPEEGFVTHAYNGLVTHIHSFADHRSGLLQAAFCSNDRKLRTMDIRSLQFTNEFSYEHAINCSTTSPDGRLRVLAGDSSEVLITDTDRGQPLVTLNDLFDNCFACDWSHDGRYVVAAAEDSNTAVWDARNWSRPLRKLSSAMSCARSVNFTDNGALVVAENDDVVRVYDGGCFDRWQEIRFFGSIAGVALLDGGSEMVVANADKTVGGLLSFERTRDGSFGASAKEGRFRRGRERRTVEMQLEDVIV